MKKEFALFSRGFIIIQKKNGILSNEYIELITKNLSDLGFSLDSKIIDVLKTYNEDEASEFYKTTIAFIIEKLRTDIFHKPMYPNFPKQVMEADIVELTVNAIIHYICNGAILPEYEANYRQTIKDNTKDRVLLLGTDKDLKNVFINLVNAKTSISEEDKEIVKFFIEEYKEEAIKLLPDKIYMRETMAFIMSLVVKNIIFNEKIIKKYVKTAIDVLRLAAALSNGDISLSNNTKFISFKRSERRLMLSILDEADNIEEDILKYKNRFIRLGERLHPGEYKERYFKAYEAFRKLRNNIKIETFNGKVEEAILNKDIVSAVNFLRTRPSVFARNIDRLLRINIETEFILENFKAASEKVSTPILLQLREHFIHRCEEKELRIFFPKGNICSVYGIDKSYKKEKKSHDLEYNIFENIDERKKEKLNELLPPYSEKFDNYKNIDKEVCKSVVEICTKALINIYANKETLGKVYVDEKLKNFIIPFSQRSASKALKTITRGSRVKISEKGDTIRFFLYWKQPEDERVDLDLSAVIYDENWRKKGEITYYNLRDRMFNCAHSGDIVAAPNGASEFIDIDMKTVKEYGGKYVAFSVNAYTETMFCDLPECFAGWMIREYPNSGEIYEPKTVSNKFDIASSSTICLPMIVELEKREIIWTDVALKSNSVLNNVKANNRGMVLIGKGLTNLVKPNLFDLFYLNAISRGTIAKNKDEADIIFSLNEGITPFNIDEIVGEYL